VCFGEDEREAEILRSIGQWSNNSGGWSGVESCLSKYSDQSSRWNGSSRKLGIISWVWMCLDKFLFQGHRALHSWAGLCHSAGHRVVK